MRHHLIVASLSAAFVIAGPPDPAGALQAGQTDAPRESRIPVGTASLSSRELGRGEPMIVLHGGPDFDHRYLLPDLDRLADAFRLMRDTWEVDGYDLLPKLRTLRIPTLVISGDHDFIPAEIAEHIARAIPNARLVRLRDCGHFAYLECAGDVRNALNDFFRQTRAVGRPR